MAAATGGQRARPVIRPRTAASVQPQAGSTFPLSVTPVTITFQATDPDTSTVAGSSPAPISWTYNGQWFANWNLTVQAPSATLTNCPGIPVSAITATCSSSSANNFGAASCAGAFPLSTTPHVVASGIEGVLAPSYQVQISYTISDTWKRAAQLSPSCSLSLTYIATLP
jgi:hypothetical protein